MATPVWSILSQFVYVVPPVIAYIIGLVLAFQRKQNHPYSAGLATWGFLVLLVETLLFSCVRTVLIFNFNQSNTGLSSSTFSLILGGIGLFQVIFFTIGIGLLIAAIFSDRGRQPLTRRREPADFDAPAPRPRDVPPSAPTDQPETFREKRES